MKKGFVYLAGSGPGDPGLITVKALAALREADCVIYDFLANPSLVENLSCEKIYVGKSGSDHTLPQEDITALVVKKGLEGKTVVRLKGGDPFIFGRGGEEAEALVEAGVQFAIIPGVSSFYSAPAYAGIPITHRDFANAIEVITGHRRGDADEGEDVNFPAYDPDRTFAFLMGVKNLDHIARSLIGKKNFPAETPVGVISRGTHPEQRVVTGTLADIASRVKDAKLTPPAIIVVGGVVSLRERLRWFDNLPLFGKKIVVTRTRKQASKLSEKLAALGAKVIEFPTIDIVTESDLSPLRISFEKLASFRWIIFTSQNAVEIFFSELFASGRDARSLGQCSIAAIGPATADELKKYGLAADLVPEKFIAESLLDSMKDKDCSGANILIPCSSQARPALKEGLEKMGAHVERVHLYRADVPKDIPVERMDEIRKADMVTFTSSSTAENFFAMFPDLDIPFASIGPVTTGAVRKAGRDVVTEAAEYTIDGLVSVIEKYFMK